MPRANIPFLSCWFLLIADNRVELSLIDDLPVHLWCICYLYFFNLQPICQQAYILYRLPHAVVLPIVEINRFPASVLQVFLFIVIQKQLGFYLLVLTHLHCCFLYQSFQNYGFLIGQGFASELIDLQGSLALPFFLQGIGDIHRLMVLLSQLSAIIHAGVALLLLVLQVTDESNRNLSGLFFRRVLLMDGPLGVKLDLRQLNWVNGCDGNGRFGDRIECALAIGFVHCLIHPIINLQPSFSDVRARLQTTILQLPFGLSRVHQDQTAIQVNIARNGQAPWVNQADQQQQQVVVTNTTITSKDQKKRQPQCRKRHTSTGKS